jgi:hypothetical protein
MDSPDRMGLTNWLKPIDHGHWEMNPETGIARRTEKLTSAELDTCAACHSRRKVIAKDPVPGELFLDAYLPALLEPGRRGHLLQLSQPAQRQAARQWQCAVRSMPHAGKI